jgi:O-antigen/teichoic acid export membrane protein
VSLLKRNVVANFGGQVVTALIGLLVVPFYQQYLGMEGYGLVSFFLSLQTIIGLLDLGLSTTANREIGKLSVQPEMAAQAGHLLRTLEIVYLSVAVLIFAILASSASWIANHWIQAKEISGETIRTCVILAGSTVALRWPISLYAGVLRGLEKHVALNALTISCAVGKAVGSVLVIVLIANTVTAFYGWQLAFGLIETGLMWRMGWRGLRPQARARAKFDQAILQAVWRYAFKIGWISIFAVVLKQLDKVIVSKVLPIEQLGFYNTASLAAVGLGILVQPVQSAVFPRFTKLIAQGDSQELIRTFHRSAQLVAFVMAPAAGVLAFFSENFLLLWTRSHVVAQQASGPLMFLALAALINAMMSVPFVLQLASGLTWLPLCNNGIALLFLAPCIYLLVLRFGILGGAMAWLAYNVLYYAILPHFMFHYVLQGEKRNWIFQDTLPFIGFGLGIFWGIHRLCEHYEFGLAQFCLILVGLLVYLGSTILFSDTIRSLVVGLPFLKGYFLRSGPVLESSDRN